MDCTRHPPSTIGCISKLIEEPIVFPFSLRVDPVLSIYIYISLISLSFVVYTLYLKSAAAAAAASFFSFLSNRLHVCACAADGPGITQASVVVSFFFLFLSLFHFVSFFLLLFLSMAFFFLLIHLISYSSSPRVPFRALETFQSSLIEIIQMAPAVFPKIFVIIYFHRRPDGLGVFFFFLSSPSL